MSMTNELKEIIKEDLIRHEGYVAEIYLCSEGIPTFGIGHMVVESDPEYTWPVGTPVEKERIDTVFEADCDIAIKDCEALFPTWESMPDKAKRVLVNMAFNLGRNRLSQFKNMREAVGNSEWKKAAEEMTDSRWYYQVGRRSKELVEMMRSVRA